MKICWFFVFLFLRFYSSSSKGNDRENEARKKIDRAATRSDRLVFFVAAGGLRIGQRLAFVVAQGKIENAVDFEGLPRGFDLTVMRFLLANRSDGHGRETDGVHHGWNVRGMVEIERPERKRRRRKEGKRRGRGDLRWWLDEIRVAAKAFGFDDGHVVVRGGGRGCLGVLQGSVVLDDERLPLFALRLLLDEFRGIEIHGVELVGFGHGLRVVVVPRRSDSRVDVKGGGVRMVVLTLARCSCAACPDGSWSSDP